MVGGKDCRRAGGVGTFLSNSPPHHIHSLHHCPALPAHAALTTDWNCATTTPTAPTLQSGPGLLHPWPHLPTAGATIAAGLMRISVGWRFRSINCQSPRSTGPRSSGRWWARRGLPTSREALNGIISYSRKSRTEAIDQQERFLSQEALAILLSSYRSIVSIGSFRMAVVSDKAVSRDLFAF